MLRLSKGRTYTVPVVMRALDILEFLFHNPSPMKLDEISRRTRVARSSTYRILGTLEHRGYVSRSLDGEYEYCRSKPHLYVNSRSSKLSTRQSSIQRTDEALWVEHTIETLLALLQESRRGNTVPLPMEPNVWHQNSNVEREPCAK